MSKDVPNPLVEIGEYAFEDLCKELLRKQPEITSCNKVEARFRKQYGADLLAESSNKRYVVIGQCKRYSRFDKSQFAAASTAFLDHLDGKWKSFNIKKFVLFLACEINGIEERSAINVERERFHQKGIVYEVWDKTEIFEKLQSYESI